MAVFLFYLFKALRPRQWIKNIAVFAPIIFTGQFFSFLPFSITLQAFFIFCLMSSGSYLINDILDIQRDKTHPFKKLRPIASGKIPVPVALLTSLSLYTLGLLWAFSITISFFFTILIFFLLHLSYSFYLKHVPVIDIMVIAFGYFIRVYAGEFATGYHLPVWLSLCVLSLSLFLAIGKRRAELTLLQSTGNGEFIKTRATLGHYSERLLDVYTAMLAASTWITYSFYTFLERPPTFHQYSSLLFFDFFPGLSERKWLMVTIPFVLYGMMRYMQLIYENKQGESPERVVTTDKPLLLTVFFYGITVLAIIYLL